MRPRKSVNVAALVGSPEDEPSRPNLRLRVVGGVVIALFLVLGLRLWSLQVVDGKTYAAAVTRNQVRQISLPAPRGVIVDRNDTVLAGDVPEEEILLSRATALSNPSIVGKVAALVGQTPKEIKAAIADSQYSQYAPVPVLANASMATVEYLDEHASEYPGVTVQEVSQRAYPQNQVSGTDVATGILGYVSPISAAELKANATAGYSQASQYGQTGLENEYEQYLRGTDGQESLSVDAQGEVVGTLSSTAPVPGDTVVTNIDLGLQEYAQSVLQQTLVNDRTTQDPDTKKYPTANDGAVVVLNAQTGAVLAMASSPTYDLSEWVGGISTADYDALSSNCQTTTSVTTGCPLINYAIDGEYTPGSTFKLNTATAALDDGVITPNTTVNDTGVYHVPQKCTLDCTFTDDEDEAAGPVNVEGALTQSDDYFFYQLGDEFYYSNNPAGIQQTAADYGLGRLTGIDLPGEYAGEVDSAAERAKLHKEDPTAYPNTTYFVGDNIETAFGQGETLVTPIQQAVAYATFANGGTRYQPEVAAAIVSPTGKVIKQFAPKVTGHVSLPPSTYQPMLAGFEGVVNNKAGTANAAFAAYARYPSNYVIAGKTGTADVGLSKEPNSWFVGFGPTDPTPGTPEYVVAVVVDHGGYGAQAAAPAAAQIYNYLYANPVQPVQLPTAKSQPSATPPSTVPPAAATTTTTTPAATTTTTTTTTPSGA